MIQCEVNLNLSIMFAKFDLLQLCQILIAKNQNEMFEKRLMDLIKDCLIDIADIDADYLCAERV